jgi:FtsZ-binding cell division protein ZapB
MEDWLQQPARCDGRSNRQRFEIQKKRKTAEGYLDIWGVVASAVPLVYTDADIGGARVEMPAESALKDSIESLLGAPVTLEHPPVGLLTDETAKQYTVGTVLDAKYDPVNRRQTVRLRIYDREAIQAIETGKKTELSPGYRVLKGELLDGEKVREQGYNVLQTQRHNNHVAITVAGRGEAPLRVDSATNGDNTVEDEPNSQGTTPDEPTTSPEHLDSEENMEENEQNDVAPQESMDAVKQENSKLKEQMDAMSSENKALKEQMDAMQAKLDGMNLELPNKPKANNDNEGCAHCNGDGCEHCDADQPENMDSANFADQFREHKRALQVAAIMQLDAKEDEDTLAIKRRVVDKAYSKSGVRVDGKSKNYIINAFDHIASGYNLQNTASNLAHALTYGRNDARPKTPDDMGVKAVTANEWRKKIANPEG